MIEVYIVQDGEPLGHIELQHIERDYSAVDFKSDWSDYTVRYAVNRGDGTFGAHNRVIYGFPRKYYNVFALVLQGLTALNEKDLKLERDFDLDADEATVPADLARRLRRALPAIQAKFSRLHHH